MTFSSFSGWGSPEASRISRCPTGAFSLSPPPDDDEVVSDDKTAFSAAIPVEVVTDVAEGKVPLYAERGEFGDTATVFMLFSSIDDEAEAEIFHGEAISNSKHIDENSC